MHHKIYFPTKGVGMHSLTRRVCGKGVGAVILDGGIGGQSSYPGGIEEYLHTTSGTPLRRAKAPTGEGLGKISAKLSNLTIKPVEKAIRRKPIAFSV